MEKFFALVSDLSVSMFFLRFPLSIYKLKDNAYHQLNQIPSYIICYLTALMDCRD